MEFPSFILNQEMVKIDYFGIKKQFKISQYNFYWRKLYKNFDNLYKNYSSYILHSIGYFDFKSYKEFEKHFNEKWFNYEMFTLNYFNDYFKDYPMILDQIKYWNTVEESLQDDVNETKTDRPIKDKLHNFFRYEIPFLFRNIIKSIRNLNVLFDDKIVMPYQRSRQFFSGLEYLNLDYMESLKLFFIINKIIKSNYIGFVIEPAMELLKEDLHKYPNEINTTERIDKIFISRINYIESIPKIHNHFENMIYIRNFILTYLVFNDFYLPYFNTNECEYEKIEDKFKKLLHEFIDYYIIDSYDNLHLESDELDTDLDI